MHRYPPAARAWLVATVVAALAATVLWAWLLPGDPLDRRAWLALGLFALGAAVAHCFPIKTSADGATYQLTNLFLVAGAATLPTTLLAPLVAIAITPQAWQSRRRPGVAARWAFNAGQSLLAAQFAHGWAAAVGVGAPDGPRTLVAVAGAALLFTIGQNLILGVMVALFFRKPLRQAEPLAPAALAGDGLAGLLGALAAILWLAAPLALALFVPLLVVAHRLTRTAHLAQLAQVDVKTGLHNARHFELALAEELQRAQRLRQPLALLFADLDHFKRVNDTHGHAAGDKVLQDLASLLRDTLRQGDVIARFGGEEFVALLPATGAEEASYLAERLRGRIEAHSFALPGGAAIRCTISVGLAACPGDGTTVGALLEQADLAMYRAKQTRNAVARADALPPVPRLADAPAVPTTASTPNAPSTVSVASTPIPVPARRRLAAVAQWGTVLGGLGAALVGLVAVTAHGDWPALLPYLALAVAAEALTVQILETKGQRLTFSFTVAVALAAAVAVPAGAPLVSLAAALVHAARTARRQPWGKALFNLANPALAAACAGLAFAALSPGHLALAPRALAALLAAPLAFYLANIGMIALMIALHSGRPVARVLGESLWSAPTTLLLAATGAFLGASYTHLGLLGTALFAAPLLVMRFTLAYYARRSQAAIAALEAANAEVGRAHGEKEQTLSQLIRTIAAIIDARDNAVAGHSDRVATYAVALGRELGLGPKELAYLHTAGLLHDLGKVGVPEAILHKPARLTAEEFAVVKEHAATGERILAEVKPLAEVARMVGDHHERFDGTGYPNGEAGEAISRGGRIVAVADVLDSILSDRPYSKGKPLSWALEELDRCAGSHFDPEVVAALHRVVATLGPAAFANHTYKPDRQEGDAGGSGVVIPFPVERREDRVERVPLLPAL